MHCPLRSSHKPEPSQTGTNTTFSPTQAYLASETVSHTAPSCTPARRTHPSGAVAGQAIVPTILDAFDNIVNTTNPVKLMITAIAYKPFLSLFNMTGVAAANPQLAGIGESPFFPSSAFFFPALTPPPRQWTMPPSWRSRFGSRARVANPSFGSISRTAPTTL